MKPEELAEFMAKAHWVSDAPDTIIIDYAEWIRGYVSCDQEHKYNARVRYYGDGFIPTELGLHKTQDAAKQAVATAVHDMLAMPVSYDIYEAGLMGMTGMCAMSTGDCTYGGDCSWKRAKHAW